MKGRHKVTKYVSYLRVSTQRQGVSGLGLEAQRHSVAEYVTGVNGKLIAEYVEVESGRHNDRPKLALALAQCRLQGATLVTAKLDRLARNVAFVSRFLESGVEFCAVDFPAANRFMIHILAAVGEYEAKMISDRTKAALQAAKRRGVKLGGERDNSPGITPSIQRKGNKASATVRTATAQQRAADLAPVIADLRSAGAVSLAQIAAGLNSRGIPTARGGEWSPVQVMRVIEG
jgi:DNA invertase Pin-like site-specific DNA recombinase